MKGFTLLEVLITIVIMTAGLILLLEAISIGLFAGGQNENDLVAVALANEKLEDIRNMEYDDITDEAKAAVSGFSSFEREVVVTTPETGLKQIIVNVYWPAKGEEASESVVTYVSDI